MKAFRIRVTGRVQGVFYRATTKTRADELGLHGWVKNEPDGSVLLEVHGPSDRVEEIIQWCKVGPTYAKVMSVEFEEIPVSEMSDFEIRY